MQSSHCPGSSSEYHQAFCPSGGSSNCDLTGSPTRSLTLDVQLGSVLGEPLQADLLTEQGEELLKGGASFLVVVHFLLRTLACPAVEDPHFVFPAELQRQEWLYGGTTGRDVREDGTKGGFLGC